MLHEYLNDIALTGNKKHIKHFTQFFLKEWREVLESFVFVFDEQGNIINCPNKLREHEHKIMSEYIMLRCLLTNLENGCLLNTPCCCRNDLERKYVSVETKEECKAVLDIIAQKFSNSQKV